MVWSYAAAAIIATALIFNVLNKNCPFSKETYGDYLCVFVMSAFLGLLWPMSLSCAAAKHCLGKKPFWINGE